MSGTGYAAVPSMMQSSYELEPFRHQNLLHTGPSSTLASSGAGGKWPGDNSSASDGTGPQRYVQHTDFIDSAAVVELPPQYDENRQPIPGLEEYQPGRDASLASESRDSKRTRMR
jgi:hypothetical protein